VTAFVPGLQLSGQFYFERVAPALSADFPGLRYSAALLGRGSEVLGFDDEMSMDHDWNPRVQLFVGSGDLVERGEAIEDCLRRDVPGEFRGRPVSVSVFSVGGYFEEQLAIDIGGEIEARDWLTLPEHRLLMFTAGKVFHDEVGLQEVRDRLAYYPRDVWLYLLMAGWWRIHPELNLVGRSGFVGDDLGSSLIGSQLVADLMRLCFLMERQYAPYSKWFGTAFARLSCGPELTPTLRSVLRAEDWKARERALLRAYEQLADLHNASGITAEATLEPVQMWDRPFTVGWADFPDLLRAEIRDPAVAHIADSWPVGPVDQFRHLLWPASNRRRLLRVFDDESRGAG